MGPSSSTSPSMIWFTKPCEGLEHICVLPRVRAGPGGAESALPHAQPGGGRRNTAADSAVCVHAGREARGWAGPSGAGTWAAGSQQKSGQDPDCPWRWVESYSQDQTACIPGPVSGPQLGEGSDILPLTPGGSFYGKCGQRGLRACLSQWDSS